MSTCPASSLSRRHSPSLLLCTFRLTLLEPFQRFADPGAFCLMLPHRFLYLLKSYASFSIQLGGLGLQAAFPCPRFGKGSLCCLGALGHGWPGWPCVAVG